MILIVDDDGAQRRIAGAMLTAAGRPWMDAESGEAALALLKGPLGEDFRAVLLDLGMAEMDGIETMIRLRRVRPHLPVIILTANGSVANAVRSMRAGAADFLIKPTSPQKLESAIRDATGPESATRTAKTPQVGDGFAGMVAEDPATRWAMAEALRAARSTIPMLIEGESGVGKEVFARGVHKASARAAGPFVAVNCGALPEALVESILFGHEKGAFTGAVSRRIGKFEEADGGTLFLDEIGDLPRDAQVKLLRAIQEGEIDPVGGSRTVKTDIRLISATNRRLAEEVAEGRFREDLFYRVGVFAMTLPPLRRRRRDIPALATLFAERIAAAEGATYKEFSPEAVEALTQAPWPGNVRQLENVVHRAVVLADGPLIEAVDLGELSGGAADVAGPGDEAFFDAAGHIRPLAEIEADALQAALRRYDGAMTEAARRLRIGRSTLYRKVQGEDAA